jgi:alkylhydroperoxidase/carboxymuconolactone decarboxylase family protein YurZ
MNILENEDSDFADLIRCLHKHIADKKQNLELKHKYLIMAAVSIALDRREQAQHYVDLAADEGASVSEIVESLQPSSCCWKVWRH